VHLSPATRVLIEANIDEGVVSAPLSKYLHCQTRICRPVGLSEADCGAALDPGKTVGGCDQKPVFRILNWFLIENPTAGEHVREARGASLGCREFVGVTLPRRSGKRKGWPWKSTHATSDYVRR